MKEETLRESHIYKHFFFLVNYKHFMSLCTKKTISSNYMVTKEPMIMWSITLGNRDKKDCGY